MANPIDLTPLPMLPLSSPLLRRLWTVSTPVAVIGKAHESNDTIKIGDIERRGGLYILGKTGMGKSWLIVNLIRQDIEHGHGLLFIDPHGKAIDELIGCCDSDLVKERMLLFDPTNKDLAFSINILSCKDVTDLNEYHATYTRAKGVFDKLWKTAYFEMPWLQKIVQYTIYAFIENPAFTLSEVALFLTDRSFRDSLVKNIKQNPQASYFWQTEFRSKEAEAALTRVETLLGDTYVRDIISQSSTTIDFTKFIDEKRIVLVKLPDSLSSEVKTFIGTILISELVHCVKRRSANNPSQFGVFVDEFQQFCGYEDFATLFTQARKYGVATTIAHQERYGQFADNKAILGGTG